MIYLLLPCYFSQVLRAEMPRLPRFSQLLHASMVLNLVGYGLAHILGITYKSERPYPAVFLLRGAVNLMGAVATALAYQIRRRCGDSLTLALNYSILV